LPTISNTATDHSTYCYYSNAATIHIRITNAAAIHSRITNAAAIHPAANEDESTLGTTENVRVLGTLYGD